MSVNDLMDSNLLIPMILLWAAVSVPLLAIALKNNRKRIFGENEAGPVVTQRAKVLLKQKKPSGFSKNDMIDYIVFECENNQRVELAIKDSDINAVILEGDTGFLSYQGKRFIDFKRGNNYEN